MVTIKETADALTFEIYVQPGSSNVSIIGCHQKALKIKLTAPPIGGAANKQCIQILAKTLGLPKSAMTITRGQTNRRKQICVHPMNNYFTSSERNTLKAKLIQLSLKNKKTS